MPEVFHNTKNELEKGVLDPIHPFKFFTVGTHFENEIDLRSVVLRSLDKNLNFYFFTDSRSGKVFHLRKNSEISLHFYHDIERVQVRVKGVAEIHQRDDLTTEFWSKIPEESKKSYNSISSPGSIISSPSLAYEWRKELDDAYFTVIKVEPLTIEVLQLNGVEHIRALFVKNDREWEMNWLAP
ncbi:pyridoxamine 5'-phosphate oxidase family protein [Shivajiella indica]|uniref:Pyridoxamine 5'-phosphate oxidase family protein n=1 Tax=Shivajiella indica TaxID=872115 RepID=A0ABW5BC94_9BACT